jgi:hypothetical protein
MKEKINQLILETKNVPSVHISNKEGFDKLVSSFKVLKHLRKSSFTFEPIDETSIKDLIKELKEVTTFCLKNSVTIAIKIDGMIQFRTILNHYKSDALGDSGIEHSLSNTYFTKYDEQRMRKEEIHKIMDNFRYAIARAYNLAIGNQFPFGVRLDRDFSALEAYDRSNLTEFSIINLLPYLNQTDTNLNKDSFDTAKINVAKDSLKKKDVESVITEIKKTFQSSYPKELDVFVDSIKDESASSEFNICDIIGKDGIVDLLDNYETIHIRIGNHDVISGELESINNRNNPWTNINFLYQHIMKSTNISFVTEAKLALKNDEYSDVRKYFKDLIDLAPEYCLVPVIAYDYFNARDFNAKNDNRFDKYKQLADLMEGKDVDFLKEKYESILKIPDFKYELTNEFYTTSSIEVWKSIKKKLSRLKAVLKKLKSQTKQSDEVKLLAPSKIDGIISDKFGYNSFVTLIQLYAGDGKTIKNSPDNVIKAIELFMETYFGDKVFTVSETKNEYVIKDDAFLKLLTDTDSGGYGTSHTGRAEYFLTEKLSSFKESYEAYEGYIGTNDEMRDIHIATLKQITKLTEFGWYEDTVNGKVVYCGWNEKGEPENASWEHINNTTQTTGAIRALETNSADGAKTKAFNTISKYYSYILEQQSAPKIKKKYKEEDDLLNAEINLKKIIKYFKQLGE